MDDSQESGMNNQQSPQTKSYLPKLPKGTGFSKRLLILLAGIAFTFIILFLIFIDKYAKTTPRTVRQTFTAIVDEDDSSEMIDKIQKEPHQPSLVMKDKSKVHGDHTTNVNAATSYNDSNADNPDNNSGLTSSEFKAASNAQLSVYHHEVTANASKANISSQNDIDDSENTNTATNNSNTNANAQSEKIAFLKNANQSNDDYIHSTVKKPLSPYELKAGTIIPATLLTGINSDLPGTIIAKVRRDVFDTVTGNYLLIPQGTTLVGVYDSQITYGQSRVLIAWSRLIFPNGNSYDLSGQPGVDLAGMAGLSDITDHHYTRVFGSALMFSVFGALGQLSQPQQRTDQLTTQQIIYAAIGQQMSQTAMQLVAKEMNVQPTIKIRPGMNFNVLLARDVMINLI